MKMMAGAFFSASSNAYSRRYRRESVVDERAQEIVYSRVNRTESDIYKMAQKAVQSDVNRRGQGPQ